MQKIYNMLILLSCWLVLYVAAQSAYNLNEAAGTSSTKKMKTNAKVAVSQPLLGSIQASDDITLAYAAYIPDAPAAKFIFYHGSGAHSLAGYTYMAEQLALHYNVATYLFDIRGHGRSGGSRGDAPHADSLWQDVVSAMQFVRKQPGDLPIILGGHSGGAGMLINYAGWAGCQVPDGYIFIAPMLGKHAHVVRTKQKSSSSSFVQVNYLALLIHQLTYGLLAGRWHAVHFNYPDHLVEQKGFVKDYTVNVAQAMHPYDPLHVLSHIQVPVYVYVADQDELFDPIKMDTFFEPIIRTNKQVQLVHIPHAYHLTILGEVHDYMGLML